MNGTIDLLRWHVSLGEVTFFNKPCQLLSLQPGNRN